MYVTHLHCIVLISRSVLYNQRTYLKVKLAYYDQPQHALMLSRQVPERRKSFVLNFENENCLTTWQASEVEILNYLSIGLLLSSFGSTS